MNLSSSPNFVEREAAYLAARERIFGMDDAELKEAARQRPRNVPVVARRMIAHALGQRINHSQQAQGYDTRHSDEQAAVDDIERRIKVNLDLHQNTSPDSSARADENVKCIGAEGNSSGYCPRSSAKNGLVIPKLSMKEENMGAAKRMFAHALGIQASKDGVSRGK